MGDPTTEKAVAAYYAILNEVELWEEILREAKTNPVVRNALDEMLVLYHLAKRKRMAAKMLDLKRVMSAADNKNYGFYDSLPDDEKKLFSPYLGLRWMASVTGNKDLQAYYVLAVNEQLNKHFWDVSKHPKLAWLAMAAAAPGVGSQFHYWVAPKKGSGKGKLRAEIARRFPVMKDDEIDLFMTINTEQDLAEWLTQHGMDLKEVKALLK